jgi:hypothetical protein
MQIRLRRLVLPDLYRATISSIMRHHIAHYATPHRSLATPVCQQCVAKQLLWAFVYVSGLLDAQSFGPCVGVSGLLDAQSFGPCVGVRGCLRLARCTVFWANTRLTCTLKLRGL